MLTSINLEGFGFHVAQNAQELCRIVREHKRGVLRIRTLDYSDTMGDLIAAFGELFDRTSPQFDQLRNSMLLCADCLWEYPGSYVLSLIMPNKQGEIFGATPGYSEFGQTGICAQCGGDESLIVYEFFPPEEIGQEDVEAIRTHWHTLATQWWQTDERSSAICDYCGADVPRNSGFLNVSRTALICESCVNSGLIKDGLKHLRDNPHYYGTALLRKIRRPSH